MKLTNREKRLLSSCGYSAEDMKQIETICRFCKITKGARDEKTTHKEFIKQYGKDNFLLNLARAIFHCSSCYIPAKNIFYIFDCYGYFYK